MSPKLVLDAEAVYALLDRQQHDWHHAVPRERSASGARMSITLRHSRPAGR